MAEWFNQARFDLNAHSTKSLIEWAKDQVDTARLFARTDYPPRPPEDMLRAARKEIEHLFRDKPAALVLEAAGQGRDAVVQALDAGKFDVVLSGLDQAIRLGTERDMPAAAALAAPSIEAQARHDAAERTLDAAVTAGALRQVRPGQVPAAGQRLGAAPQDAPRSYWEAAADSGRKINKVTGGFRAEWSASVYAAAATVIATGGLHGLTALAATRAAPTGQAVISDG